jgi:hypothetical protein
MDQNFQTSFIPKKPIVEERVTSARPVGVLLLGSIFILFVVLLGTGGIYFYKINLNNNLTSMQTSLNNYKTNFEPSEITQLQVLDKRLQSATDILNNHIAISPVFAELENITMHTVRFTKFSYGATDASNSTTTVAATTTSTNPNTIDIQMSGIATDYRSVALQSDLFNQDKNFINPVFSNLTLDINGNVLFDLEFSVPLSFVNYKQSLSTQIQN